MTSLDWTVFHEAQEPDDALHFALTIFRMGSLLGQFGANVPGAVAQDANMKHVMYV